MSYTTRLLYLLVLGLMNEENQPRPNHTTVKLGRLVPNVYGMLR